MADDNHTDDNITSMDGLIKKIFDLCTSRGLSYSGMAPVQVSPGVYLIYATEMNYSCKSHGHCRQKTYTIVEVGNQLKIV